MNPPATTNFPRFPRLAALAVGGLVVVGALAIAGGVGDAGAALFRSATIGMAFVAGLVTGSHCIGMCGGFVVCYVARSGRGAGAHLIYALAKTVSCAVLGALCGLVGQAVAATGPLPGLTALFAGVFLLGLGAHLLGWPALLARYRLARLDHAATWLRERARRSASPLGLGLANGLMLGCGPLLAMYAAAAGTGRARGSAAAGRLRAGDAAGDAGVGVDRVDARGKSSALRLALVRSGGAGVRAVDAATRARPRRSDLGDGCGPGCGRVPGGGRAADHPDDGGRPGLDPGPLRPAARRAGAADHRRARRESLHRAVAGAGVGPRDHPRRGRDNHRVHARGLRRDAVGLLDGHGSRPLHDRGWSRVRRRSTPFAFLAPVKANASPHPLRVVSSRDDAVAVAPFVGRKLLK